MLLEIVGLVFSIIVGTIGHFLYDWSNKNKVIGFIFAKNESTWEHIKLGVTPIILWTIIELLTFNLNCVFFAKFISIITFILLILVFYYAFIYFFKINSLFFDILLFYFSLAFSYFISIKIIFDFSCGFIFNFIGVIGLLSIIFLYYYFNKKTPNLIIFKEP